MQSDIKELKELEITFEKYTSLLKGEIVRYSKYYSICREKGSNCKGCCFNRATKIGGCPVYKDKYGDKHYPCIVMDCVFKKIYY